MMCHQTSSGFAEMAERQAIVATKAPGAFFVGAMLAGAFVAIATILALSVAAHLDPAVRPVVMGAVFGISMLLTLFAGGELFTGQAMFTTFGLLHRRVSAPHALWLLVMTWVGNLCGAIVVVALFAAGGGGQIYAPGPALHDLVAAKLGVAWPAVLARAILCNWLACLGIWAASRLKGEAARIIVLTWCVLAYVACGLDHSIANMALFALGLMAPVPAGDIQGAAACVGLASIGNLIGGSALVACAYAVYGNGQKRALAPPPAAAVETELPHLAVDVRRRLMAVR